MDLTGDDVFVTGDGDAVDEFGEYAAELGDGGCWGEGAVDLVGKVC